VKHYFHVREGSIGKDGWAILWGEFSKHEGKDVCVSITRGRKRSSPQNNYYWGVVIPLAWQGLVDLGNDCDEEDVHEYLKERFGKRKVMQDYTIAESTTKMTTLEFEEYLERIKRFAAVDLCVNIPDPNYEAA